MDLPTLRELLQDPAYQQLHPKEQVAVRKAIAASHAAEVDKRIFSSLRHAVGPIFRPPPAQLRTHLPAREPPGLVTQRAMGVLELYERHELITRPHAHIRSMSSGNYSELICTWEINLRTYGVTMRFW